MDFSEIDQENKYKDELRCGFPVFFNKITTLEEMNYLNLIDRAFYFIRLREKFYQMNESLIGEEAWKDEEESFYFTVPERFSFRTKEEYTWEKFINEIDDILVSNISKTLKRIKVQYELMDVEWILSKPNPVLLNDPNLLVISPFLFKLTDWISIIQNDVSKIYGKPVERNELKRRYLNIEATSYTKKKLQSIASEIEDRIDNHIIKDYGQQCSSVVYIKTSTTEYMDLIKNIKFHKKVGLQNIDLNIKGSVILSEKQELSKLLIFNHDQRKLCTIFFIWLNLKKGEMNQEKRELIKNMVSFFHSSTTHIRKLDIPDLSPLNDSLFEIMSALKYFKEWQNTQLKEKRINQEIVQFKKVEDLFFLFKKLQLSSGINDPSTFRTYYYKKTEFPDQTISKINHHLH